MRTPPKRRTLGVKNWKKAGVPKRSLVKSLFKPGKYTTITPAEKGAILLVIAFFMFLGPMYAYWQLRVAPYASPGGSGGPNYDPFTTLWNGETQPGNPSVVRTANTFACTTTCSTPYITTSSQFNNCADATFCTVTVSVTSGQWIEVLTTDQESPNHQCFFSGGGNNLHDSQTNTYTTDFDDLLAGFNGFSAYHAVASATGSDVVSINHNCVNTLGTSNWYFVMTISNVGSVGVVTSGNSPTSCTNCAASNTITTTRTLSAGSLVFDMFSFDNPLDAGASCATISTDPRTSPLGTAPPCSNDPNTGAAPAFNAGVNSENSKIGTMTTGSAGSLTLSSSFSGAATGAGVTYAYLQDMLELKNNGGSGVGINIRAPRTLIATVIQDNNTCTVPTNGVTISDSLGSTFTQVGTCLSATETVGGDTQTLSLTTFWAPLTSTSATTDVVTVTVPTGIKFGLDLESFTFTTGLSGVVQTNSQSGITSGTGPFLTTTSTFVRPLEVYDVVASMTPTICNLMAIDSHLTPLDTVPPGECFNSRVSWNTGFGSNATSYTDSNTLPSASPSLPIAMIHETVVMTTDLCGVSWQCFKASVSNGDINTNPDGQYPGIAESVNPIDLSPGVSKAIAFAEAMTGSSLINGQQFGWFLRTNATLPNEASYNPLTDPNVVMYVYTVFNMTSSAQYYVMMQRQAGQPVTLGQTNPFPNCDSSTTFICESDTNTVQQNLLSLVLNYTGAANPAKTGSGQSYLCLHNAGSGGVDCQLGGANDVTFHFAHTDQFFNYTLPWLNLQNSYRLGFYMSPGRGSGVDWSTSSVIGAGNIISIYTSPTTPASATTLGSDFTGWLGRSVGGAWNTIQSGFSAVSGVIGSSSIGQFFGSTFNGLLNLGNSFLSVIIGAIQQTFQIMISAWRVIFNQVGKWLGLGNLGDALVNFFVGITNFIVNGLGTIFGWLVNLISLILDIVSTIAIYAVTTVWNFFDQIILFMGNLITWALTIFGYVTFPLGFVLLGDWSWGTINLWFKGTKGWIGWIRFNILFMLWGFYAVDFLVTKAVKIIAQVKGLISPTATAPA